jgi:serine/threonine protein phosphatase PrpC
MKGDLQLDAWQLTDPGKERAHNEDYCGSFTPKDRELLAERGQLYLVADGIGGHQAGDVASQYAVEQILYAYYSDPWVNPADNLVRAIRGANAHVYREAQGNPTHRGMGTTLVAAAIGGHELTVANVGDSRAYLVREGQIRQISQDHSWVAERVAENLLTPDQARNHPKRNVITRSLGNDPDVEVDVFHETIRAGDVVLLCSDGLSGLVRDEEMVTVVSRADSRTAAERLVRLANERGGTDNITATVIRMGRPVLVPSVVEATPVRAQALAKPTQQSRWLGGFAVLMIVVAILGLRYGPGLLAGRGLETPSPTATTGTSVPVFVPTGTLTPGGAVMATITETAAPTETSTLTETITATIAVTSSPTQVMAPTETRMQTATRMPSPTEPLLTSTPGREGGTVIHPGATPTPMAPDSGG